MKCIIQGNQYASDEYQKYLQCCRMKANMSRQGNCWDNAPTERMFKTLQSKWLNRFRFQTKGYAKASVWEYITYDNAHGRHSVLVHQSPMECEQSMDQAF